LAVQQLTGRLPKARNVHRNVSDKGQSFRLWDVTFKAAAERSLWEGWTFAKTPRRSKRTSAVLGRYALGKPGDCNAARRPLRGESRNKSQVCAESEQCSANADLGDAAKSSANWGTPAVMPTQSGAQSMTRFRHCAIGWLS